MSRWSYITLLVVLLGGLLALEVFRERPLDLRVRLERTGDAPFDAEVFFAALPAWLGQPVEPVGDPPFVVLDDTTLRDRTYLFLTLEFAPDPAEAERLLRFVARGNTVVVIASAAYGPFFSALAPADSAEAAAAEEDLEETVETLTIDPVFGDVSNVFAQTQLEEDTLRLVAPGVAGSYGFPVDVRTAEVVGLDPERSAVLGRATWPYDVDDEMVTLARVRYGAGTVLLSSTPIAFTNAALTGDGDGDAYLGAVLAALPQQPVLWDDHGKPYREQARTPLRFVLTTPGLRGALGMLLLAGLLYLLFRARRWQRPVPVVAPPPNAQREFARTVGRLRYVHRDDRGLADRMARHVLDRLRTDLRLAQPALDDATAPLAAARAGVPEDEARALFAALRAARASPTAAALVRLDAQIARFFRHTGPPAPASP